MLHTGLIFCVLVEVIWIDYSILINIFTSYIDNTIVALSKLYKILLNECLC